MNEDEGLVRANFIWMSHAVSFLTLHFGRGLDGLVFRDDELEKTIRGRVNFLKFLCDSGSIIKKKRRVN